MKKVFNLFFIQRTEEQKKHDDMISREAVDLACDELRYEFSKVKNGLGDLMRRGFGKLLPILMPLTLVLAS